jgi:hypothetical protein
LHLTSLPLAASGLVVAWLAWLATLVLLWRVFLSRRPRVEAATVLVYAAFAPGVVYSYALFPLSLLSLGTLGAFASLQRRRWRAAGVCAAVATLSYPIGCLVAPVSALWLLAGRGTLFLERVRRAAAVAVPSAAAIALFALDQQLETGHWNAYLLVQAKYGHAIREPFGVVIAAAKTLLYGTPVELHPGEPVHTYAPALQTLLVAFLLICVLVELAAHRSRFADIELMVALWAVIVWVVSHAAANISTYRGEAALVPVATLLPRLPRSLAVAITAGAIALVIPMTRLYLRGVLF